MSLWEISTDNGSTYTDLATLYFYPSSDTGTGMLPVRNLATPLAQQPGSQYDSTAVLDRPFALHGSFNTTEDATKANFHSRKATLLRALNANAGTLINSRPAPIVLKYTGATDDKIIYCYYEGGFEDSGADTNAFSQDPVTLRFVAFDPFFYAASETTVALDPNDGATFTVVGAKVDGLWDNLGPPNASGTYTDIRAFAEDDTYIYIGGNFQNFDNIANADRIVRMNKSTGVYTAMGTGAGAGGVYDLAIAPNGDLYAVGDFLNMGGIAAADYVAVWDGSAWAAVGTPGSGATVTNVYAVEVGPDGNVYVGGNFLNLAGVAACDYVAYWNGTAWTAMATGCAGIVRDIAIQSSSKIYYMGSFTDASGVSDTDSIAYWNGSAWNSVAAGSVDNEIRAGALTNGGELYVCGLFTTIGGLTVSRVAKYNGTSWEDVGGGVNNTATSMAIAPNGNVYIGGVFTAAGGLATGDGLAIWNGSTWAREDMNLPGTATVYTIHFDENDDLYIGFDTNGTAGYAGSATVAYAGTAVAYPYVTINRSGGTSASVYRLTNTTTGAEIYLDYALLDGETLTLDFRPFSETALTAVSSFFGPVPGAILGGSNTGQFYLTPGRSGSSQNNVIALYVGNQGGSPTITANLYYTAAYLSQD